MSDHLVLHFFSLALSYFLFAVYLYDFNKLDSSDRKQLDLVNLRRIRISQNFVVIFYLYHMYIFALRIFQMTTIARKIYNHRLHHSQICAVTRILRYYIILRLSYCKSRSIITMPCTIELYRLSYFFESLKYHMKMISL